jgi:CO/xanthine dehydrogenase Mo-binding subunit
MDEHTVVGKDFPRIDALEKSIGSAQFGADLHLPGMLQAMVLRSPHAHARIRHINTSNAACLPGVKGVITAGDFAQPERQSGLAHEVVRCVGEGIAAVAAVDRETAEEALELMTVEYEELPAVFTPREALQSHAPLVHTVVDGKQQTSNILYTDTLTVGDIEAGFQQADLVLEHTYTASIMAWSTGRVSAMRA